ncbi:MAG: N-formylglutamate amidohydrolase [Beijerinckiaceae bacterium]|nr:N-formylglutamate amidohydrolase [Beijerinckiaceae bacterium]
MTLCGDFVNLHPVTSTPDSNSDDTAAFEPVEIIPGALDSGLILLCDHASNALPREYGSLGLPAEQFARHIAWDIGAAAVTRALSARFGAPAVLSRFSRLLIDPNRGVDDPTLVMKLSDGAIVPGNINVDGAELDRRRERFWRPYREKAADLIRAMIAAGKPPAILSIHSFTPVWRGVARPWEVGLLWDSDPRLAQGLLEGLEGALTSPVGDNEPYDGALVGDTLYDLGTARGLAHVIVEFRQDLIDAEAGALHWAGVVGDALAPVLMQPDLHIIRHHPSRAGARVAIPTLRRTS